MDLFTFGNVNSNDYGIWLFDLNTDVTPESLAQEINIPGRNGALLMENYYFQNVEHRYMGVIYEDASVRMEHFRSAMLASTGYLRLEDSIHPEEFYIARYMGGLEPKLSHDRKMVKFAIEFSRKPQRYLKMGEKEFTITNNGTLKNPSPFDSQPLITVGGYGTLSINGVTVTIENYGKSFITIDSELMDCYSDGLNMNQYVTFQNSKFPALRPGDNGFTYSGNITSVKVIPRWWML